MKRKSVIKHIIAEASGHPILAEQYALQDVFSPIIKEMRALIEQAKGRLKTIKSLAMKIESGKLDRESLTDVKNIWKECNHNFSKILELYQQMRKELHAIYTDEPMPIDLATAVIKHLYLYGERALATSHRAWKYCEGQDAYCTIEDVEEVEETLDKLSETLYSITKGMLY